MGNNSRGKIPEPQINKKIKFSFEFYDTALGKYCLSKWDEEKIAETLKRLREVNQKTIAEIFRDSKGLHFHPVDWSKTIEKAGFPNRQANELDPYHFALLGVNGQKARVYGAFDGGVFYIIWFDFRHEIWPTFLKHT